MIKILSQYLSYSKKNLKFKEISNRLFEKYIDYDDKKVLKTIRKIIIIYSRHHKKLLLRILYKWKKNMNLNNQSNKLNEIEQQVCFSIYKKIPLKRSIMYDKKILFFNPKEKELILLKTNKSKSGRNSPIKKILNHSANLEKRKGPIITKQEQENLFNSLYNDSQRRKEKLRKMSQEKENKFNSIYTFTPNVIPNKLNEKYLRKLHRSYSKSEVYNSGNNSFIDRLNNYEKVKSNNLKKIKAEIEGSIPHPKNLKIDIKDMKLILNSQKYMDEKNKRIEKLKENILIEKGITFKPKLNEQINSKIQSDIIERNENFLKAKEIRLHAIKEDSECTFIPKINENLLINQSNINSDVSERLYDYQNIYKKNLEEKKSKYKETYSFRPEISKNTKEILENRQKIMEEIKSRYVNNNNENNEIVNIENIDIDEKENKKLLLNLHEKKLEDLEESVKRINELADENIISIQTSPNSNNMNPSLSNNEKNEFDDGYKILKNLKKDNIINENNFNLPQNYVAIDETLDRLQLKYKNKILNSKVEDEEKLFHHRKNSNGQSNDDKDKQTNYSLTNSKTKSIVNLNYYESLI